MKWHWFAGGGLAILFAVLLAFRLDVFSTTGHPLPVVNSSEQKSLRNEEQWMSIMQGKRKVGYAHRTMVKTEQGYRQEESVLMRINTMGVVQDMRMKTESDLNADMTLSAFNFELESQLFRFFVKGEIKGKKATILYGMPASPKKIILPLQEIPRLSNGIYDAVRGKNLKKGDEAVVFVLDPASMGQRPVRLEILDEERITIMGRDRKVRKVAVDFMGARQFAWLGEEGDVLREEGLLGMTIEQVSKEQATDKLSLVAGADLTEVASIPANRTIEDPDHLTNLVVRLTRIETGLFNLEGGRQHYKGQVLTIEKEAWPPKPSRNAVSAENEAFLKPSPFIQSTDPLIRRQLKEIISSRDSDVGKAEKIVQWIYQRIEKRPVLSVPNAVETLENRMGDCNEHAVLLAAMARAAGIPAQIEAGLVYQRGRFYYHAWNVLYLGQWVTADAVFGKMPADVTHIRLVRGGAERQIDLMGALGKLKLEILETEK